MTKIEKNKTYTYEEIKEIYENAMIATLEKPTGNNETGKDDAGFQFQMMLSAAVILHTMEENLFEKEGKEND